MLHMMISKQRIQQHALKQGHLHECVLPHGVLREVAILQDLPGSQMVSSLEWYYTNSQILPLWDEQYLVYDIVLPIIAATYYEGFKIETFPIPMSNSNTTIKLMASNFIALDSQSSLVVELQQCQGEEPVVWNQLSVTPLPSTRIPPIKAVHTLSSWVAWSPLVDPFGLVYSVLPHYIILATWGDAVAAQVVNFIRRQ